MDNDLEAMHKAMINIAKEASTKAYAPYSGYKVGAAIITEEGMIYHGCNIENASYGATICAERVAIFAAISNNENDFTDIVIYCNSETLFPPCGICLQVLAEFAPDIRIVYANDHQTIYTSLKELLPTQFTIPKKE